MAKKSDELRRKAEEIMALRKELGAKNTTELSTDRILEELSVFQIELELQNEELLQKQVELEVAKGSYEDLFNSAPNGYLVIDRDFKILKCNRTFAEMIGTIPQMIINKRFSDYLLPRFQDVVYLKCNQLFKDNFVVDCEVGIKTDHQNDLLVRLDGKLFIENEEQFARISIIDITRQKSIELQLLEKSDEIASQNEELQSQNELLSAQNEEIIKNNHDLKKLNVLLNYEKNRAQSYLDLAGVMFVAIGPDGKVFLANKKACDTLGFTQEEIISINWFDNFLPAEIRETVKSVFGKILSGEIRLLEEYENSVINKHGQERIIAWRNTILTDESGKVYGTLSSGEDVTERKKAEAALRESEEKYRVLVETANEGFWSIDKNHVTTFVNEAMAGMIGYSIDEMVGQKVENFFYDEDLQFHHERMINRHQGVDEIYERRFRRKDGSELWTLVSAKSLLNKNGVFTGSFALFTDITNRKRTEEALIQSEKKFRTYIENSPTAIFIANKMGNYTFVNQSAAVLLGYTEEELLQMSIPQILPESEMEKGFADFNHVKTFGYSENNELKFKRKDGTLADILIASIKLNDDEFMAFCREITDLKNIQRELQLKNEEYQVLNEELQQNIEKISQINDQLNLAKAQAEESDRLKSAFLANMSHEIRTPMNGILGFADLLKEPDLTGEEQQKYISIIEKSGQRMLNIINDLIDISKIEAGQMEVSLTQTNINNHLSNLYIFFKPEAEKTGLALFYSNGLPDMDAIVKTDSEKLYAILTNLIKNAVKYTHQGSIEFGYQKKEDKLEFFVKDTGIGIQADKLGIIFERFVQADSMITKSYEGAGLGLSISKAYVEMLGGKIWVESQIGKGSTFRFVIPFQKMGKENDKTSDILNEVQIEEKSINLKILIAEDTEASDIYLSQLVRKVSSRITHVTTGIDAVKYCRNHPDTDLVLMDIKMPEMDGYEATRRIREFNNKIIIIAQTAYALSGDREKALEAGCNDHIPKPLRKAQLYGMINKYF